MLIFLFSCKKEQEPVPEIDIPSAGIDISNIKDFQTRLNADTLTGQEKGQWSILSGMIDDKVYFDNDEDPRTIFHGLPGETYELEWSVINPKENNKVTKSTVKVSFNELKVSITNERPELSTRFLLTTTRYDHGEWTIEGAPVAQIWPSASGGYIGPTLNFPGINIQGYANKTYTITWTTNYGSKSASATITLKAGEYLESEAIEDLILLPNSPRITYNDEGRVVELDLSAKGSAWRLGDTVLYPTMQAFTELRKLNLDGSAVGDMPVVFGEKYLKLEELNISHVAISHVPENIGNLKQLRILRMNVAQSGKKLTSIPDTFGDLESLELLELMSLSLEELPETISNLKNLRSFDFQGNDIKKLPDALGDMVNLVELKGYTSQNIPSSVTELPKLKILYFLTGATNASLPDDFGNIKSLEIFKLGGDFKKLPNSFCDLPNLYDVELGAGMGTSLELLPENIGNLKSLVSLTVNGHLRSIPESFSNLTNLENLVITGGEFETLPIGFGNLKKLAWFSSEFGKLRTLPDSFGGLENLKTLYLYYNQLSELPESFFNLSNLFRINIGGNNFKSFSSSFSKLNSNLYDIAIYENPCSEEEVEKLKKLLPDVGVTF
ncbi:leucine-rich repeat domain-containing protein [Albibacterium indicum]|uniref:leucine-rich repeat domain-containing protein n=1 Tax=Albibacterium indicum TaxID=2292082 RepID=UPI0013004355|nr:hypothetical protein [Pedobacter indicus]